MEEINNKSLVDAISSVERVVEENAKHKVEIEQLRAQLEAAKADSKASQETLKTVEPYIDVIKDTETKWVTLSIKNPYIWKSLKIRAKQVYGSTDNRYLTSLTEAALSIGLFNNWAATKSRLDDGGTDENEKT